jgi:hypothetical protein
MTPKKAIQQPQEITFDGKTFVLVSTQKDFGNGITEGPFYQWEGDADPRFLYTPDLGFLTGVSELLTMHRVQVSA